MPAFAQTADAEYVEVGEGVMDFKALADALKATGFGGFLSLEQDGFNGDMREACWRYVSMMKEYLS